MRNGTRDSRSSPSKCAGLTPRGWLANQSPGALASDILVPEAVSQYVVDETPLHRPAQGVRPYA